MKFLKIPLEGACLVELEPVEDERGFLARLWCEEEFRARGLNPHLAQCSLSFNKRRGTLRGMHYQENPHAEAKLVCCSAGALYDVIVDLRPGSPTYCKWFGLELSVANRKMLYVPEGFAHGFQTLADDTEIVYLISEPYRPECARGVRWNDPLFGIQWPIPEPILSQRDRSFQDYKP
jgi:dTDP-4-dehydrorhamnose 3,5-epimerase